MISLQPIQTTSNSMDSNSNTNSNSISSPRISFSAEFLDEEKDFINISNPNPKTGNCSANADRASTSTRTTGDFEFLSAGNSTNMITADELFSEGKLLPFWQMQQEQKLNKISVKTENLEKGLKDIEQNNKEESRVTWFLDDDPSPRPPTCTVLWKELLRLKKQRASSTLSPSSSSSRNSILETSLTEHESKEMVKDKEKVLTRIKKGLERTRSANIRIRPVINVPIYTQGKNNALTPLFYSRKGKLER